MLLDLGMSSMQIDTWERGFSYSYDAPLDMRMDPGLERSAHELVNEAESRHLETIFRELGEERYARQIARAIVRARARKPIASTIELVDVITQAIPTPARFAGGHPAKRVFQALRIAVNDELGQLDAALPLAWALLRPHGRLAAISFHSLEDRRVKRFLTRTRAGLHLPAGPAGLRLRSRARGRARQPPLDRADARRDRRQPARAVGAPAGRREARTHGGSRMSRHAAATTAGRTRTIQRTPRRRAAARAGRPPRRRPPAPRGQPQVAARASTRPRSLRRRRDRAVAPGVAAGPRAAHCPGAAPAAPRLRRRRDRLARRRRRGRRLREPRSWTASCAAACGSASSRSA